MAKKKTSDTPQQGKMSLEKLIQTRSRNLEIDKCYISKEWKEVKECNVIVTRKHVNGNLTIGVYLVDLLALGVRDSFYYFNEEEETLDKILGSYEEGRMIECDYITAHNVVFASVEWADDWGFKPAKEFTVSEHILEEDTDEIPLLEIKMGNEGKPAVVITEENHMTKELEQLKRSAGIGKFDIIDLREDMPELNDEDDGLLPGWDDDVDQMKIAEWTEDDWEKHLNLQKPSFRVLQYYVDAKFYLANEKELDKEINPFVEILGEEVNVTEDIFEENEEIDQLLEESDRLADENKLIEASDLLKMGLREHPNSELLQLISYNTEISKMNEDEITPFSKKHYNKNPDSLTYKILYAAEMLFNERLDEIPAVFDNKFTLKELYPEKKSYDYLRLNMYCGIMCEYFMYKNDLIKAEPFYELLDMLEVQSHEAKITMQHNIFEKMKSMPEISN